MNAHNGLRKPNLKRKKEGLSELEGLLAVVGLEVTTEGMSGLVHVRRDGGREFQILRLATLKLRAPVVHVTDEEQ